ncbi:hypothetical protein E2C01_056751 [Portunus trituberculatus]|uniref:Uncharacterized protein n=1 Tax=Portunus trituberculatus TaxID=210409 RepID=A0A5B7GV03_PORTR|nr:hypothetical protein [Portunus trituberculatus]
MKEERRTEKRLGQVERMQVLWNACCVGSRWRGVRVSSGITRRVSGTVSGGRWRRNGVRYAVRNVHVVRWNRLLGVKERGIPRGEAVQDVVCLVECDTRFNKMDTEGNDRVWRVERAGGEAAGRVGEIMEWGMQCGVLRLHGPGGEGAEGTARWRHAAPRLDRPAWRLRSDQYGAAFLPRRRHLQNKTPISFSLDSPSVNIPRGCRAWPGWTPSLARLLKVLAAAFPANNRDGKVCGVLLMKWLAMVAADPPVLSA